MRRLSETNEESSPFILGDQPYRIIKWLIIIVIPAIGTLYFALAKIWDLPAGEQILGTLIAFQAFLGAIFAVSTSQYNSSDAKYSGEVNITENPEGPSAQIAFNEHPTEFADKKEVIFKVNTPE